MRQFWVKNAKGQIFDMNREDAFFSSPKGLGIARETSYEQAGYTWTNKKNKLSRKRPSGNMVFDGYEQYDEFIKIVQYTPLTLMYQPLDTLYLMEVHTFTIEKSEINHKDTFLTCKITFEGVTPWYTVSSIKKVDTDAKGKTYSYLYPYTYLDNQIGEITIENEYGMDAYCKIIIFGPLITPSWTLTQAGEVIASGRMLSEIEEGRCLIINSDPRKYEIAEYDMDGKYIKDRYQESDFSTVRFIRVPPGKSILKIIHSGTTKMSCRVEVMKFAG